LPGCCRNLARPRMSPQRSRPRMDTTRTQRGVRYTPLRRPPLSTVSRLPRMTPQPRTRRLRRYRLNSRRPLISRLSTPLSTPPRARHSRLRHPQIHQPWTSRLRINKQRMWDSRKQRRFSPPRPSTRAAHPQRPLQSQRETDTANAHRLKAQPENAADAAGSPARCSSFSWLRLQPSWEAPR